MPYMIPCRDCRGRGSLWPGAVDISDHAPCPNCEGTGKVEARWGTADGQGLLPSEMSTRHIENALNVLRRRGYVSPSAISHYVSGPYPSGEMAQDCFDQEFNYVMEAPTSPFIDFFEEELKKRLGENLT